jgi:hypothetical protein
VRHSNSKNLPYYFDTNTMTSRWEPPAETDVEKLKLYMAKYHSGAAVAAAPSNVVPGKIRAAHLLVKHEGSRRPASWREVGAICYLPIPRRRRENFSALPLPLLVTIAGGLRPQSRIKV